MFLIFVVIGFHGFHGFFSVISASSVVFIAIGFRGLNGFFLCHLVFLLNHGFNGFFLCFLCRLLALCRPSRNSNLMPRLCRGGRCAAILTDHSSLKTKKYFDYD